MLVIADADVIYDKRVADIIGAALMEGETLQILGSKRIDRRGPNLRKRDTHFDPVAGGKVAGVLAQIDWLAETGREFSDLEPFAGSG